MTAKAAGNSRSKASVSLTLAAVARQATGTPSPSVAMWYLVPLLPRSVGLGPVRSPPRLARTKQVSRIRSRDQVGVAAQHADQQSMDFRQQTPLGPAPQAAAQGCATGLTRGGTQAAPGRALALDTRRSVATTRIVSLGGCPGPRLGRWSQASMTVAIRCKSLKSIAAIPVWCPRLRQSQRRTADQINSTLSSCENCL